MTDLLKSLKYMDVGDVFESEFLSQATDENRTIEETLGILEDYLNYETGTKIKDKYVEQYYKKSSKIWTKCRYQKINFSNTKKSSPSSRIGAENSR